MDFIVGKRSGEMATDTEFFTSILTAGSLLTGFSATFLQFRIQREATYFRQPALSFDEGKARDIFIGLSHFTSAFLLILISVMLSIVFGFCVPVLKLAGVELAVFGRGAVAGGIIAALTFLLGYFVAELVHYRIFNVGLLRDRKEWGRQWPVVRTTVYTALALAALAYWAVP